MNKAISREVLARADRSPEPISYESAAQALEELEHPATTGGPGLVQERLARALEIENQQLSGSDNGSLEEVLDPTIDLGAADAFEGLEQDVMALRQEIFGSAEPPFETMNAAGKWICDQKGEAGDRQVDKEELQILLDKARRACNDLGDFLEIGVFPKIRASVLPYYQEPAGSEAGTVVRREGVFRTDTNLWKLLQFVALANRQTGLSEADVVALVLNGGSPKKRISVEWTVFSFPPKSLHTVVTIPKRFPIWADMREAYEVIREARKNRRLLDAVGSCLIDVIRTREGVPARGIMKFWDDVAEQVRDQLGEETFTPRAALRRYEKLPESLRVELEAPIGDG